MKKLICKMAAVVAMVVATGFISGCGDSTNSASAATTAPALVLSQPVGTITPEAPTAEHTSVCFGADPTTQPIPATPIPDVAPKPRWSTVSLEAVPAPVVVHAEDFFSIFYVVVPYNPEKVEIESKTGVTGGDGFVGIVSVNSRYVARERNSPFYEEIDEIAEENSAKGLATCIIGGGSLFEFKGRVVLTNLDIKAKTSEEINLSPQLYYQGLVRSSIVDTNNGKTIEEHSVRGVLEAISISPRMLL